MKTLIFIFAFACSLLKAQTGTYTVVAVAGTNTVISPNNTYTLNCYSPQLSMIAICSSSIIMTYTWASNVYFSTGSTATLSMPGNYTVTAQFGTTFLTQTLTVGMNTTRPISSASSTFQVVTGTSSPQAFTFTAISPTVNTTHIVYSPFGGQHFTPGLSLIYMAGGPGTYTHCIRDDMNGCESCHPFGWGPFAPGNYVGLKEENILTDHVYPNPSNGIFTLDLLPGTIGRLEVYNVNGVLIKREDLRESEKLIDLQAQTPGIYLLRIFNEHGISRFLRLIKD